VDAYAALNAGQIDAVMLDTPIVLGAVEEKQVKDAEVVGQFKTGEVYGAVVGRDSKNLAAFNTAIKAMVADGTRDKLYQQYFAEQAAVPVIPI
jgi:ABC-type amino acid transport substrate-binding protein